MRPRPPKRTVSQERARAGRRASRPPVEMREWWRRRPAARRSGSEWGGGANLLRGLGGNVCFLVSAGLYYRRYRAGSHSDRQYDGCPECHSQKAVGCRYGGSLFLSFNRNLCVSLRSQLRHEYNICKKPGSAGSVVAGLRQIHPGEH